MYRARALLRATEPRRHYGKITAKTYRVLETLLWGYANAQTGYCYPSYESIAARAGCSRAMVSRAIKMLEAAGLLSWVHRLARIRIHCPFGSGWRWRVIRTSNAYRFSTESNFPTGTPNQDLNRKSRANEQRNLPLSATTGNSFWADTKVRADLK
jgi:DNA-binding transcriptional MocR family regulator